MKKIKTSGLLTAVLFAIALQATECFAVGSYVSFRWYNTDANSLTDSTGAPIDAGNATVLSYLSSDNMINFESGIGLSSTYGDDFYFNSSAKENSISGELVTGYITGGHNTSFVGKFAYAIVLDMPLATFNTTYGGNVANVPADTYYAVTGIFGGLSNYDNGNGTQDSYIPGPLQTSTQVVPEPATALLLGIGGIGTWLLRRSKR